MWSQNVATGKSLISLKTIASPKKYALYVCSSSFYFKLFHFFFFLRFFKKLKVPKTVQCLIVYKIFHFNIQFTAKTERKPKRGLPYEIGF